MQKYKIIQKEGTTLFTPNPVIVKFGDVVELDEALGALVVKNNIAELYTEPMPTPEIPTVIETIAIIDPKEPDEGADDAAKAITVDDEKTSPDEPGEPGEPGEPDEGATDEPKIRKKNKDKNAANAE